MRRPNEEVATIILAGGGGDRLSILSEQRAVPSVPFAGKYRIIDFTLSNCVNSGLYNILVLTQYRPLSLRDHIGNGRPWDLDRLHGGVTVVSPYLRGKQGGWERGTADAVYRNIEQITEIPADNVLILGGDHIYKMDYQPMLRLHREREADVTIGVIQMSLEDSQRFGIVQTDETGRVVQFQEKPERPEGNLVSMGIYVFNKEALIDRLLEDSENPQSRHDFGRNILPKMVERGDRVYSYTYKGYWQDAGTVQAYWNANMALLEDQPELDLYSRDWVIYTRSEERPPAILSAEAKVERSMISHGCQIKGRVEHSVLSPGVVVEEGAVVRDSIIMLNTVIGKNSVVDRAIIDKNVTIGPDSIIGQGDSSTPNQDEPDNLMSGITVIGKRAELPAGIKIGRNCKIGPEVTAKHFSSLELAEGETVELPEVND
ncbi:MAG TPA: glucose-1-phosphate adenylyltransferase [Chloroflexia bacterium]|nr:glucose-1-phosphate adenylyltransferase [Chloroflexia bacterium]